MSEFVKKIGKEVEEISNYADNPSLENHNHLFLEQSNDQFSHFEKPLYNNHYIHFYGKNTLLYSFLRGKINWINKSAK